MRLKIAVCDKEKLFCEDIQRRIWINRPEYNVVLYQYGEELLKAEKNYDIVFLDTEISDRNGMEVASKLRDNNYNGYIIFLTNQMEFMAEAFKVKAFRFFEKTITERQFYKTILEIEAEIFQSRKMIITDSGIEKVVKLEEILYVEAINNKTVLHMISEEVETGKPLKHWKEVLGTEFFYQTHKSYIIGLKHVKEIKDGEAILHCSNQKIPISRRNYANCKKALYTYIREYGRGI